MVPTYQPIANSTYLDYAAYGITSAPTVEIAYDISDGEISPNGVNVALVLPRATDSSGFLTWGFEDTYGGGDHDYNDLVVNLDFSSAFGNGWLA